MSAITAALNQYDVLVVAIIATCVVVTGFFAGRKLLKRI